MNIVFRTDASLQIGIGHVMRCLTLADALRTAGAKCHFICRKYPGNLTSLILQSGFTVSVLPFATNASIANDMTVAGQSNYAAWLGADWSQDAAQTKASIGTMAVDLLIADNYAIDMRWEKTLRPLCRKLVVIDDLANRQHDCDILLERWERLRPYFKAAQDIKVESVSNRPVLCHGDIHPGNVIVSRTTGRPILLDWDLLSVAPCEWDHAALLTWATRWGGQATTYSDFARGYGSDFSTNELAKALAELRLLSATLMRWQASLSTPSAKVEAENRMKWWRQDPTAPMWRAV